MIKLINIKKNNNIVECDILPEDSKKYGHIIVDIKAEEIKEYTLPDGYKWCINHVHHAHRSLIQIVKEENLPKERNVVWY